MNRFLFILLSLSFYFGFTQSNTGYVVYKTSLTEAFEYTEEFKTNNPEVYNEMKIKDSLIGTSEIAVAFNKVMSRSFLARPIETETELFYEALAKINFDAEYSYDSQTMTSKIKREFWFNKLLITVNLKDKWEIDLNKTKIIDGHKCYYASYNGQDLWSPSSGKKVSAWFTTDIPLQYGPLQYNGLPGLIIELNEGNVRLMASKIVFDNTHVSILKPIESAGTKEYDEYDFIKNRENIKKKAKRIITGN